MRFSRLLTPLVGLLFLCNANADSPAVDPGSPAAPDNIARCQSDFGPFSFHAPAGWKIRSLAPGITTACDMRGEHDCVAMISAGFIYKAGPFKEAAQNLLDREKKSTPSATVQVGELQPYTTASGWQGFKAVVTRTYNGQTSQLVHYYFPGPNDDCKVTFSTSCHGEDVDRSTPLFEEAVKSLVQE